MVSALVEDDLLASFDHRHQFIECGGRCGNRGFVVVKRNRFGNAGDSVHLAIHGDAVDASLGIPIQFASHQHIHRGHQPGADFVAQAVVGGGKHIGTRASGDFSLVFIEELIERNG